MGFEVEFIALSGTERLLGPVFLEQIRRPGGFSRDGFRGSSGRADLQLWVGAQEAWESATSGGQELLFPELGAMGSVADILVGPWRPDAASRAPDLFRRYPRPLSSFVNEVFLQDLFADCCRFLANRTTSAPSFEVRHMPPPELAGAATGLPEWGLALADEMRLAGFRSPAGCGPHRVDVAVETYPGPWVQPAKGRSRAALTHDNPPEPDVSGCPAHVLRTFSPAGRVSAEAWQAQGQPAMIRHPSGDLEILTPHGPRLFPDLRRQSAVRRLAEHLRGMLPHPTS